MSSPELIDERYEDLVRELRSLPGAPETLRARVRSLADSEPEFEPAKELRRWRPEWFPRLSGRRVGYALALGALSFVAATVAYGVATSGTPDGRTVAAETLAAETTTASAGGGGAVPQPQARAPKGPSTPVTIDGGSAPTAVAPPPPPPPVAPTFSGESAAPVAKPAVGGVAAGPANLPPSNGRLQKYSATMRLRVDGVDDLSDKTAQAMRIARRLGGFVASVQYATPKGDEGDATLVLRVPTSRVQSAITQFSELGTIVSQHISIVDLNAKVDEQSEYIARLRRNIRVLEAELKRPISESERIRIKLQLENAKAALREATEARAGTIRQGRLATFRIALTTREAAAVPTKPSPPGRIERAARNAGKLLAKEAAAITYVAIVAAPFLLLLAVALTGNRFRRRRYEHRLLESA